MREFHINSFGTPVLPHDINAVATTYYFDEDAFKGFHAHLEEKIRAYDPVFGPMMIDHMDRVANHFAKILIQEGYDRAAVENLRQAVRFHDLGKIMQEIRLYNLGGRPSPEVKEERKEHVFLGDPVIKEALKLFSHLSKHPHINLMLGVQVFHHERINGIGLMKLQGSQINQALEILGIIDTVDGKSMLRGAELKLPVEEQERLREEKYITALNEMTGDPRYAKDPGKHSGEFRPENLKLVTDYFSGIFRTPVLRPLSIPAAPVTTLDSGPPLT